MVHHIFPTSVLEDFSGLLRAIGATINEDSNLLRLPATQMEALLGPVAGDTILAAHTGGHLGSYYSETRAALTEIQKYIEKMIILMPQLVMQQPLTTTYKVQRGPAYRMSELLMEKL